MKAKNVPRCIREGIFCLMTGFLVFAGSGMTAQAEEAPAIDGQSTELNNSLSTEAQEAAELISLPSEPIESSDPITTVEGYTATTVTENIYVEETENAVAVTEETVTYTVTSEEGLTKDTENATSTTEGNTTTTTGQYVEDVTSTTLESSTTIVTDNEELADEIEAQVKVQETKNTEDNKITFESKETSYSVDTINENNEPSVLDITKYANEFEKVTGISNIQDFKFDVKTINGVTTVTYKVGEEDIALDESLTDLKNILIKSATPSMSEEVTTYTTLNGIELAGDAKTAASKIANIENVTFTITPISPTEKEITYTENGITKKVADEALYNAILSAANAEGAVTRTESYTGSTEYKTAAAAQTEINQKVAEGYINVHLVDGTTTHTETYNDDTIYTDRKVAEEVAEALKLEENGGFTTTDITVIQGKASEVIKDFDGFAVTTKAEYDRIAALPTKVIDNITYYVEEGTDSITLYKLDKTNEIYTILAKEGSIATPWGGDQHQEGSYIIGARHCFGDNIQSYENYDIDFDTYTAKMNEVLSTEKTVNNTLTWKKNCQPFYGENKIEINAGGTYYIDASQAGRIHLATSDEVKVVLYNNNGTTVTVPIVSTKTDYQPNQTNKSYNDFGNITPNITFVTSAKQVEVQCSNNVGNILATNSTVHLNSGNFCGSIVCDTISGFAEGHIRTASEKGYLVDSCTKTKGTADTYKVSASKEVANVKVVGEKTINEIEIDKTTTSEGSTSVDRTFTIKFSRYIKVSDKGSWEEQFTEDDTDSDADTDTDTDTDTDDDTDTDTDDDTDTDSDSDTDDDTDTDTDDDTDTDTDTDSDSDSDSDSDTDTDSDSDTDTDTDSDADTDTDTDTQTPPPNIIIFDEEVPLAGVQQVLGARRLPGGQVLGARRSPSTGDSASMAAMLALFGSSSTTLGVWTLLKKKHEKEETE